jgi:hypothetical protein
MVVAYVDTGHNKLKVLRNASVWIFEPDVFRTQTLEPLACWNGGYESRWEHGCLSRVSVVCCHVEISATGLSLAQRSLTKCDVSECESETSITRRLWPTRGCWAIKKIRNKNLFARSCCGIEACFYTKLQNVGTCRNHTSATSIIATAEFTVSDTRATFP